MGPARAHRRQAPPRDRAGYRLGLFLFPRSKPAGKNRLFRLQHSSVPAQRNSPWPRPRAANTSNERSDKRRMPARERKPRPVRAMTQNVRKGEPFHSQHTHRPCLHTLRSTRRTTRALCAQASLSAIGRCAPEAPPCARRLCPPAGTGARARCTPAASPISCCSPWPPHPR